LVAPRRRESYFNELRRHQRPVNACDGERTDDLTFMNTSFGRIGELVIAGVLAASPRTIDYACDSSEGTGSLVDPKG
jgi:hypothetical protein